MFQVDNSFLRSKFARRIFLLFISSAVVPVMVIALLSYEHISTQLNKQSYDQARIACKAIGMELYRRLTVAHNELTSLGKSLSTESEISAYMTAGAAESIAPDFEDLALLGVNGKMTLLRGHLDQKLVLDDEQRRRLTEGKTVIRTQIARENHLNILLVHALKSHGGGSELLIGKLNPDYIWAVDDLLPPGNDFLLLSPGGDILHSSKSSLRAMLPKLQDLLSHSISGHLEWNLDGQVNHASYWSVFTQDLFSSANLIVVVSQPESIALAPIRSFTEIYVPLLLVAILCISFIAAKRIRKKLVPLVTLQQATQRIASGDLAGRVGITSDDEFAALGQAFNAMAGNLESQFSSLSTMAEIDRLILSSFDARFIITTVLNRAGELTPCNAAAVLEINEDGLLRAKLSLYRIVEGASIEEYDVHLDEEEIRKLHDNASHMLCNTDAQCPSYLKAMIGADMRSILLLPTFIKGRLSTVLIFSYGDSSPLKNEDINLMRKFADHIAVALSNASWEERLYHQAHYDALTNLPNRALLKDRLEQAIARAQRNNSHVGLLFIDLDRFKLVNDSMGHAEGDIVLKKTANILTSQVRNIDTVVRFGGDEFVIIVPDIDGRGDSVYELGTIAEKIFKASQEKFEADRLALHSKMSIGIAVYPKDGLEADDLIKNADAAMYHAKGKGRARYEFFAPELNSVAAYRLQLEQDLRRALARGELYLNYQPKVDSFNGNLIGAEALIRWRHPERGMISPLEFIGIAEETGLIRDIGEWVINETCRQIVSWRLAGLTTPPIAVNVSPQQFKELNFTANVLDMLQQHQLTTDILELEITETTVMVDAEESIAKLVECREMGLLISMDDFGTGYSSLSYLRRLPIDTLKIDQSFVTSISDEEDTHAIVAATIVLAHKLGLKVVAEGVEKEKQRQLLQEMSCDAIQGYLISRPLSAEEFARLFLQDGNGTGEAVADSFVTARNATS